LIEISCPPQYIKIKSKVNPGIRIDLAVPKLNIPKRSYPEIA
jgi:hypothetical protein